MDPGPASLRIAVGDTTVSALERVPGDARALLVLAHGAGAGMTHPFMAGLAAALAARAVATLRYQFPSMEHGTRRPDPPRVAQAAVRAAVAEAVGRHPALACFAGGKSFGGRMTSQAQAAEPLPGVCGLVFVGFPLHPAGPPSTARADHLADVALPMLFLQGTRDALADLPSMRGVVDGLGARATLSVVEHADHAFHVPARSGRTDAQVLDALADTAAAWMAAHAATDDPAAAPR